jgi:hypothetical protein
MDMKSLMRQAQEMQKKMQQAQEELSNSVFEGSSAGGMVKVEMSGVGIIKKINIDPSLIKVDEKEILEDLIAAAVNNAKKSSDDAMSKSVDFLKGVKLPFMPQE